MADASSADGGVGGGGRPDKDKRGDFLPDAVRLMGDIMGLAMGEVMLSLLAHGDGGGDGRGEASELLRRVLIGVMSAERGREGTSAETLRLWITSAADAVVVVVVAASGGGGGDSVAGVVPRSTLATGPPGRYTGSPGGSMLRRYCEGRGKDQYSE